LSAIANSSTRSQARRSRRAALPDGTVTFLLTDIEGSTRLLARLGERYTKVLSDHQRLLRRAFADASGREIDTQGDAFLAVFNRAKDALAAALAGQRALVTHPWPDGVHVQVRMGLHTGEPAATRDRYIGLALHRAARICAAGHGGQILLSRATYAILADDVLPDLTFQDLGEHGLKDLDRPEQIYQLLVPDLPRLFPPLRTVARSTSERLGLSDRALEPADALPVAKRALRVVVADDSVLLREGLSRLLAEAGLDVLASAPDADELLRQIGRVQPDVALTDIKMPPTHVDEGLVAATEIRRLHPKVGVLVLSHYLDSDYAMRLLEEYPERVGYLLKDRVYDVAVLADAIRRIAEGECVVDPTIVARLMTHTRAVGPLAALSAHQRALFELAAQGRSDDAIARQLSLTSENVAPMLQEVYEKLGLGEADELRRTFSLLEFLRSST
jgi:serine/threonine-protein kinase